MKEILENQGIKFQPSSKVNGGKVIGNHVDVEVEDAGGDNKAFFQGRNCLLLQAEDHHWQGTADWDKREVQMDKEGWKSAPLTEDETLALA